jgi:tetratricopeptide (TPR) repeat protein
LQSLDIWKCQLGNDHPHVATNLNNLALLYESQGKYSEAENLAKQALVICQNRLSNQHPNTQNAAGLVKSLYNKTFAMQQRYIVYYSLSTCKTSKLSRTKYRNNVNIARTNRK